MNNPFDYTPDAACHEAFQQLIARIDTLRGSGSDADINFCRELDEGKMLGVLVALDGNGERRVLYAFSGQLGDSGFYFPGFTGPVFDYLQPDGYFKTCERDIVRQNAEIARFERDVLAAAQESHDRETAAAKAEIERMKEYCRLSKLQRKARRESGLADEAELAAMLRQSQFEKAELHRLKKRLAAQLAPFDQALQEAHDRLDTLKEKRRADSEALQQWLFNNMRVLNARGESRSLADIFADTPMKIPPSGAGECCAPKLLQEAYLRGWHPVSIAEYWYGRPKEGEVRLHGAHYPACRGKCLPVLSWMLQGLPLNPPLESGYGTGAVRNPEIIYENEWFCVVDKPAGMLSVPGKGATESVQQWLTEHYGADRKVRAAHRLDQDTSGLLIATFGDRPLKEMQSLFATRKVKKTYVALLEGDYTARGIASKGRIDLPLSPDWLDRPRQRADTAAGKEAVTDYEFTEVVDGRSRVLFHPLTGRTHQLRVHAASTLGLCMPIAGDRLYGSNTVISAGSRTDCTASRLHLHAREIEFTWPADGRTYIFNSPDPF